MEAILREMSLSHAATSFHSTMIPLPNSLLGEMIAPVSDVSTHPLVSGLSERIGEETALMSALPLRIIRVPVGVRGAMYLR